MPALLLFLKGISPREWKILAILAAVAIAAGWIYHRGELRVEARDAELAQIAKEKKVYSEAEVKTKLKEALDAYQAANPPAPPAPPVHVVCYAPGRRAMPGGSNPVSASDAGHPAAPASAEETGQSFDPGPAIAAVGDDADDEIFQLRRQNQLLKDTIRAYQIGGMVSK